MAANAPPNYIEVASLTGSNNVGCFAPQVYILPSASQARDVLL
jgi:hypothetical protein